MSVLPSSPSTAVACTPRRVNNLTSTSDIAAINCTSEKKKKLSSSTVPAPELQHPPCLPTSIESDPPKISYTREPGPGNRARLARSGDSMT